MKKMKFVVLFVLLVFATTAWATLPVTSGLVMHLEGDAISGVSDGNPISTWSDLSGNGNDATQTAGPNQPLYIASVADFNNHSVVRFDGTNDYMDLNSTCINVGSFTMFAAARYDVIEEAHNMYIVAGQDGSGDDRIRFQLDTTGYPEADAWFEWRAGSSKWKKIIYTPADTDTHIFGETSDVNGFLDGTFVGNYANTSTQNPTAFNLGSYNRGEKDFFEGDLAEFVLYDRVLSDTEIAAVSDYLYGKYIPEPATIALLGLGGLSLLRTRRKR